MATSRDVHEIISKLSSDKVKTREDGVKLLSTYLESDRSFGFCKLLSVNTAKLKPDEIPHAETWPFMLKLLTKCIELEIAASKRRAPKSLSAKTLRAAVQCAENPKFSGRGLLLLPVVKSLFSHISDIIRDVQVFQTEYSIILRHLLAVKEYRYEMKTRIYCSLVLLFMNFIVEFMTENNFSSSAKDEIFRNILTLHILLENPPGDFPETLRQDVVNGFVKICSSMREEGKISRKLIECINTYLFMDGPNLEPEKAMELHSSVRDFIFRYWLTTHDKGLKRALILYTKFQLKLNRISEGGSLVEQLLDVIEKELEQTNSSIAGVVKGNLTKDESHRTDGYVQRGLMELAASVFHQALPGKIRAKDGKRMKTENLAFRIKDGLMRAKPSWCGSFYFLIHFHKASIDISTLSDWFDGICQSFERILNDSTARHSYDGFVWILRALVELTSILPAIKLDATVISPSSTTEKKASERLQPCITLSKLKSTICAAVHSTRSYMLTSCKSKVRGGWQTIWNYLLQGLPTFSNSCLVVNTTLRLLGKMVQKGSISLTAVPQDLWELQIFKQTLSPSVLYFLACYFSRRGIQADLGDAILIRRKLLRISMELFNVKEAFSLSEQVVLLLPAALCSLSSGCCPFCDEKLHESCDTLHNVFKADENEKCLIEEFGQYSVTVLAEIKNMKLSEVLHSNAPYCLRISQEISLPLVAEMREYLSNILGHRELEMIDLPNLLFICSFICNCIYGLNAARFIKEATMFFQMFASMSRFVDRITFLIEESLNKLQQHGWSSGSILDITGSIVSFKSFLQSPLLCSWSGKGDMSDKLPSNISSSLENLLLALAGLFKGSSIHTSATSITMFSRVSPLSGSATSSINNENARFVDLDLDDSNEGDSLNPTEAASSDISSLSEWRMGIISIMSLFFSCLPDVTQNVLLDIYSVETDDKVRLSILFHLCKSFSWDSSNIKLENLLCNLEEFQLLSKVYAFDLLTSVYSLLENLLLTSYRKDDTTNLMEMEQKLHAVSSIVNKLADVGLPDWWGRIKLIDCIHSLISVDPCIGQDMVGRLFSMLQDPHYRVRLYMGRKIELLFQTWDGHDELFQDICSNLGVPLVMAHKERVVKAKEILTLNFHSSLHMETAVITLGHVALSSDKVEQEVTFTICAVAAMNPCQRTLIYTMFDNLAQRFQYSSRTKYLEQLIGAILFRWIACEVGLTSLVEIRDLFLDTKDVNIFMTVCCPWLLPSLLIAEDIDNLNLLSKIVVQPLSILAKTHFVQVFSICIALHCSDMPQRESGEAVLQSVLLEVAKISEKERDHLIKQHMVSIVSCLLSLSSSSAVPALPFFTQGTVEASLRTLVDGFLEANNNLSDDNLVDRLNVFRPDRVFKFLLEIHFRITSANHPRHRSHHLSAIEVVVDLIGIRSLSTSTSFYLFNLVGQYIDDFTLQEKCCIILSKVFAVFRRNPTQDSIAVIGNHLQFLVSKLIACYLPLKNNGGIRIPPSSKVMSLLHQLTIDSDRSLSDFVKDLEPFPDLDCFRKIRRFQDEFYNTDAPREHFLKFAKRICTLSPQLIIWSLRNLHDKLLNGKVIEPRNTVIECSMDHNYWISDPEIVSAVWKLVAKCESIEEYDISILVSDFISRLGIGDPYSVTLQLPLDGTALHSGALSKENINIPGDSVDVCIWGEDIVRLIRLLKKHLADDCARSVELSSQALQGILSTERGQSALRDLDTYERSLLKIHSRGVNHALVDELLQDFDKRYGVVSLSDSSIWSTHAKPYKAWICPLVHSFIFYINDVILRLCQDIVLLNVEVAELIFPTVLLNVAKSKKHDVCGVLSKMVEEHIFTESNSMIKSIHIFLGGLNRIRSDNIIEKCALASTTLQGRSSAYSAQQHRTPRKSKLSCNKVYWLSIDYLVVATAAYRCGSYFTAIMYVEYWCEENFRGLKLGTPDYSNFEWLAPHIKLLVAAVTNINEPDSIYGIVQTHGIGVKASFILSTLALKMLPSGRKGRIYRLTSQIVTYVHEENWTKALEYYDLLIRTETLIEPSEGVLRSSSDISFPVSFSVSSSMSSDVRKWELHKGLMRSLQQTGCAHVLDLYCKGLTSQRSHIPIDRDFTELQYEAAWRARNWDFSLPSESTISHDSRFNTAVNFHENLHSCFRAFHEGDLKEFRRNLMASKKGLVSSIASTSHESIRHIHSMIVKLQILDHLGVAWNLRWKSMPDCEEMPCLVPNKNSDEPITPSFSQMEWLNKDWNRILCQTQLDLNLLEPFISFRTVLLQIIDCKECRIEHLLQSASTLRKGSRFSYAVAALNDFKLLFHTSEKEPSLMSSLGRIEEAKLFWAQGQQELAINLAKYVIKNHQLKEGALGIYRLVGKWLAETRSSNSRIILEQYMKRSVELSESIKSSDKKFTSQRYKTHFDLAHYTDALFRSYEERLASTEWQAAMRLRKHKTKELEALIRRLKSSRKGEKTDYSIKIQELQKQLAMDKEEAEKLQDDRNNFLSLALEGYQRCLVIGGKHDIRVVFRLVSLWFSFSSSETVVKSMVNTVREVQSFKFIPLVYQIASRMSISKDGHGAINFQTVLVSLLKKMSTDHPYHTVYQLLALANGDRVKDKQRSRSSFVIDLDKKLAAENLLSELSSSHGEIITQMKQMVEMYIKLAELETKKEDTNKRIPLPREIRSLRKLELVPVVTATVPVDPGCKYKESFPHFQGFGDSIMVMNGINAPKVVECLGSDGHKYRQLAKSGNDDLRQDAVMEQFFGLVNTFLQNHRDTWKRRLRIRTYKVVPFTPSAGVLEWVSGTVPLGEYLLGSSRNGGAHVRYGNGDWSFLQCREHLVNEKDKRKAFLEVCENFRPVMHYFFLEKFMHPADWYKRRLSYTRSVAASSMVGYIVGLGDRHSMNILIDQQTAEVVHIDLGVAFEQGLMLKTPERVPFRLTRDIIDGMGVTGIEGVFRRCCEKTISVMRTNKEALLTIIQVFIHDPLYKWALSPLKALQRQKEREDDMESSLEESQDACEGNKDAARALLRVKQKLDGYEEGEIRSIQGQVQQLMQDAIDVERLCHMFPGWAAWL